MWKDSLGNTSPINRLISVLSVYNMRYYKCMHAVLVEGSGSH